MTTMTIDAEDINVDEYLSDDEIPDYRTQANNYSTDDDEKSIPYASGTSFTQHLINQLNTFRLTDQEEEIAHFLVGSVDDSGYIRRSLSDITDDLAFTQNVYTNEEEVENVLKIVQQLDPAGVGARNLTGMLEYSVTQKRAKPRCRISD
jgi:RNA polymerase sigma-54 factor